jgi:hypothetical protein
MQSKTESTTGFNPRVAIRSAPDVFASANGGRRGTASCAAVGGDFEDTAFTFDAIGYCSRAISHILAKSRRFSDRAPSLYAGGD